MIKPIVFAESHLPDLQKQAYSIRDKLIASQIIYEKEVGKAAWLTIFARSLNYRDWGHLKTVAKNYKSSQNNIVLCDTTFLPIATAIKAALGKADLDYANLVAILFHSMSQAELEAAGEEISDLPDLPGAPTSFILELGPETYYATKLLEWLWPYGSFGIDSLHETYYRYVKNKRKGLTKAEIKEKSLDIYPKTGMQIDTIISQLVEGGYCEYADNDQTIKLTLRGTNYINGMMTGEYDEDWQKWWEEFQEHLAMIPYRYIRQDWTSYIKMYSEEYTPKQAAERFNWSSCYTEAQNEIQSAIYNQLGVNLDLYPMERYMQFTPRIYLTPDLTSLKVSDIEFTVEGPDWAIPDGDFKAKRYWPNKCYVAVCLKKTPKHRGWYVKIPEGVESFEITYKWKSKSGAFKPVTHKMTYTCYINPEYPLDWLYGNEAQKHRQSKFVPMGYDEYSFNAMYCLTHGEHMTNEEICQLDRVQAGIQLIDIKKDSVLIEEERELWASNAFESVGIIM
ncbi:hypothetical protein LCS82_09735 [Vibrio harveyi]|uniref:hypothetical protein n=1 Tax=Vibrio harveyi TaxID=669 RepID=UPI003BB6F8A7